jgi:hypothetical protein
MTDTPSNKPKRILIVDSPGVDAKALLEALKDLGCLVETDVNQAFPLTPIRDCPELRGERITFERLRRKGQRRNSERRFNRNR